MLASPVAKKNAIKHQIQRRAKGRYPYLLDVVLARNDVIAKIEEQQHGRVKERVVAGVALDE